MQKRRLALFAFVALAFLLMACEQRGSTPTPAVTETATTAAPREAPTVAAIPASPEDVLLITESLTATQALGSYHYTLGFEGDPSAPKYELAGDYIAPDKGYISGTIGTRSIEKIFAAGQMFSKDGRRWTKQEFLSLQGEEQVLFGLMIMQSFASPMNFRPLDLVSYYFPAFTDIKKTGSKETMNGLPVRHFIFKLDGTKLTTNTQIGGTPGNLSQVGSGEIWIDPNTRYIHELSLEIGSSPTGTPTGQATSNATYIITFSQHGDPSISLPNFDLGEAMTAPQASPVAGDGPALVQRALDTLDKLHTFHYRMEVSDGGITDEDFVSADLSIRRRGHADTYPIETELAYLDIGINFHDTGSTETINGVATRVLTFTIPFYGGGSDGSIIVPPDARTGRIPPIGKGTVYIDPNTANVHKLVTTIDMAAIVPGMGSRISTATTVISHHNDPSIQDSAVKPDLVTQAMTGMDNLRTYHFDFAATAEGVTETLNIEGNFVAPGDVYVRQVWPGGATEDLLSGGKHYARNQGKWTEDAMTSYPCLPGGICVDLMDAVLNNFDLVDLFHKELAAAKEFRDTGMDEQIDGTQVRAFSFQVGPFSVTGARTIAPMYSRDKSQNVGQGTLYIDSKTRLIHKLTITQRSDSVGAALGEGTPPETFTATTRYSKHNDATITLPKP